MKVALVEPHHTWIENYPELGIGYITAACKREDIDVRLVKGSTRFLRDILLKDSNELIDFASLKCKEDTDIEKFENAQEYFNKLVEEYGKTWFKDYLRKNYEIATSNDICDYMNTTATDELGLLLDHTKTIADNIKLEKVDDLLITSRLEKEIAKDRPDVVSFSILEPFNNSLWTQTIKCIINRIKENWDIPIVISGPHFVIMDGKQEFFEKEWGNDFTIYYRAEIALPKLINSIETLEKEIPNVSYRKNNRIIRGEIDYKTEPEPALIPDFSQYELEKFFSPVPILPMITSRGCYWRKCAFCAIRPTPSKHYHPFKVDDIIKNIKEYRDRYDVHHLIFLNLEVSPKQALQISGRILKEKIDDIYFCCNIRYETAFTASILKTMYKAGCRCLLGGAESGSQRVLDLMDKGIKVGEIERIIKTTHRYGIGNLCYFMIGFPKETRENILKTIEFLNKNYKYINSIVITRFGVRKDSIIGKDPDAYGVSEINRDPTRYVLEDGIQTEEVDDYIRLIYALARTNQIKISNNSIIHINRTIFAHRINALLQMSFERIDNRKEILKDFQKSASLFPVRRALIRKKGYSYIITPTNMPVRIFNKKVIKLDDIEHEIYSLCDGSLSISEIIYKISGEKAIRKKQVEDITYRFLEKLLEKKYITFFQKRAYNNTN